MQIWIPERLARELTAEQQAERLPREVLTCRVCQKEFNRTKFLQIDGARPTCKHEFIPLCPECLDSRAEIACSVCGCQEFYT